MGIGRAVLVVLGLLGVAPAQKTMQLFDCSGLARQFPPEHRTAKEEVGPAERLVRLLRQLLPEDDGSGASSRKVMLASSKDEFLVRGTADEMNVVRSVVELLRQDPLPRARLQCSLLTMPAALVKAHGLAVDAFAPADETTFGKLVRDAVKQKGTLQNLPEVVAKPLATFVAEPAAKPGTTAPADDATLRLRGEMVPLQPGELGFAVQLVRGALPADRTVLPKEMLLHRAFRLEAGKAVMAVTVAADTATVVMVRCLDVASEAPKKADAGR